MRYTDSHPAYPTPAEVVDQKQFLMDHIKQHGGMGFMNWWRGTTRGFKDAGAQAKKNWKQGNYLSAVGNIVASPVQATIAGIKHDKEVKKDERIKKHLEDTHAAQQQQEVDSHTADVSRGFHLVNASPQDIYRVLVEDPLRQELVYYLSESDVHTFMKEAETKPDIYPKIIWQKWSTDLKPGLKGVQSMTARDMLNYVQARLKTGGSGFYKHKRVVKVGRGIGKNEEEKWFEFGRYIVHKPSLERRVLNVRYSSLAPVPTLPKQDISRSLSILLLDMIEHGHISTALLQHLNDKDSRLLKTLCSKADIGGGVIQHHDEEDDEEMDQFDILKDEVIAGQNSPESLRQLKAYILRFMNDGRMKKPDGYSLLAELAILT